MSLRFPCLLTALVLISSCEDQDLTVQESATKIEDHSPSLAPNWPRRREVDAHVPILAAIIAGAKLPGVPKVYATSAQQRALVSAKNLTQRLGLRSGDIKLGRSLAQLYASNLFPDRALSVIGLCLEARPADSLSVKMAGAFLKDAGRFEDAAAVFEHLAHQAQNDASFAGPLFDIYWELGDFERAEAALQRGLDLAPFTPALHLAMGRLLFESDRSEEALTHFETAAANMPGSIEAWYRLAACLGELGRDQEAAKADAVHRRLDQMEEFGIDNNQSSKQRRLALIQALEESGDQASADRERAALEAL